MKIFNILALICRLYNLRNNLHNFKADLDEKFRIYIQEEADRHLSRLQDVLTELANHQQSITFTFTELLEDLINNISLEHIIKVRSNYGSMGSLSQQLRYIFHDPEMLEHWEEYRLFKDDLIDVDDPELRSQIETLFEHHKEKREIYRELVDVLRDMNFSRTNAGVDLRVMGSDAYPSYTPSQLKERAKKLRKSLKNHHSKAVNILRRLEKKFLPLIGTKYIGQGVAFNYGVPRVLFGLDETELVELKQWRQGLSNREVESYKRSCIRTRRLDGRLKTPEMVDFKHIEERPVPVFGSLLKPTDKMPELVRGTPKQLEEIKFRLSSFYVCIYKYWEKEHESFEEYLRNGYTVSSPAFRNFFFSEYPELNIKIPATFQTPKQIVQESVYNWLMERLPRSLEDIVQSVDWDTLKKSIRGAPQENKDWDTLKTLISRMSVIESDVNQISLLMEELKRFVKKIEAGELDSTEAICNELIRILRGITS